MTGEAVLVLDSGTEPLKLGAYATSLLCAVWDRPETYIFVFIFFFLKVYPVKSVGETPRE